MVKILNTAFSSSYFLRALNLIGSIYKNSPTIDYIYIWDLGLKKNELLILKSLSKVVIKSVPVFSEHWRQCYSWKLYILKHTPCDIVYYIDASSTILQDISHIYDYIEKYDYFSIGQGHNMEIQTPNEYWSLFNISTLHKGDEVIAACNFGFKRNSILSEVIDFSYEMMLKGYNLGHSLSEINRNKSPEIIIRNCHIFRQDQTILNLAIRKVIKHPFLNDKYLYGWPYTKVSSSKQIILNNRGLRTKEIWYISKYNNFRLIEYIALYFAFIYPIRKKFLSDIFKILRGK